MICSRISAPLNHVDHSPCGIPPRLSYAAVSAGSGVTCRYGQPCAHCHVSPTLSASRMQPTFSLTPPLADEYSARIGFPSYVRMSPAVESTAAVLRELSQARPH